MNKSLIARLLMPLALLIFTGFLVWNPPPGLNNAEPIDQFINGNLPSKVAKGDIVTTEIYSNILWESPIVALPFPQSSNMLIVEMDGRFFTLSSNENTSSRTTVLDIQDRTWYYNWIVNNATSKHGGIQNVVFHPQFGLGQGKDYIYVYYIYKDDVSPSSLGFHYNRLSRFTWNGSSFNPNSELIMINQYDTAKGHDGSGLTFGNDGFLYVSVGDEGSQDGAATEHTQKIDDRFRSGVWRIDVDQQGGSVSHPINRQATPITLWVAPNPASDYLQVDVSKYLNQKLEYSIVSMQGVVVADGQYEADHDKVLQLDLATLRNGLYIIRLKPEGNRAVAAKDY